MSRLIDTRELQNVVTKRKDEYGKLAVEVDNIVEEMVRETPTVQAIPLDKIKLAKAVIKSISQEVPYRNQAFSYGISICETDKVLKILDKLIAESEE